MRWCAWVRRFSFSRAVAQHKLNNFAHSHDRFIQAITKGEQPLTEMQRKVRNCRDVHDRRYGPLWAAYDGKLPSVPGWPRNPDAPSVLNTSLLEAEEQRNAAEVAKLTRLVSKQDKTRRATSPSAPFDLTRWALHAAAGRLSSTRDALDERRRRPRGYESDG